MNKSAKTYNYFMKLKEQSQLPKCMMHIDAEGAIFKDDQKTDLMIYDTRSIIDCSIDSNKSGSNLGLAPNQINNDKDMI